MATMSAESVAVQQQQLVTSHTQLQNKGQVNVVSVPSARDELDENKQLEGRKLIQELLASKERCQELEVKNRNLENDNQILEQGFAETKNRLETELITLQENLTKLEREKQHFNVRFRDKDTAMKDLADKFADLAAEKSDLLTENIRLKNSLRELSVESQQSVREQLKKKFKEVEDLYDELHEAKLKIKQLESLNKHTESMGLKYKETVDDLLSKWATFESCTKRKIKDLEDENARLHDALNKCYSEMEGRLRTFTSPEHPASDFRTSPPNIQAKMHFPVTPSLVPCTPFSGSTALASEQHLEYSSHGPSHLTPTFTNVPHYAPTSSDASTINPHSCLPVPISRQVVPVQDLSAQMPLNPPQPKTTGLQNENKPNAELYVNLPDIPNTLNSELYANLPPVSASHLYHNLDALRLDDETTVTVQSVPKTATYETGTTYRAMNPAVSSSSSSEAVPEQLLTRGSSVVKYAGSSQPLNSAGASALSQQFVEVSSNKKKVNKLEKSLDREIEGFKEEYWHQMKESKKQKTNLLAPHDPNLICHFCDKQHRVGEIQKYKEHYEECKKAKFSIANS